MTFKAQTDDVRESAALTIVPVLLKAGLVVSGHDPKGRFQAQRLLGDEVLWHDDVYAAVSGADAVVILTEWEDYRHLDLGRIARSMRGDHLFDYRNLFSVSSVVRHGLTHHCLGRATIEPEQPSVYSEGDRKAATG